MASERFAEVRTPLILSILMVLMTQVGYLDLMNLSLIHISEPTRRS